MIPRIENVQGLNHVGVPRSTFRADPNVFVSVAGLTPATSVYNLQMRTAAPPDTNFTQNVQTRIPVGWATNGITSVPAQSYGGAFGGQTV